jgi:hypothetical protein
MKPEYFIESVEIGRSIMISAESLGTLIKSFQRKLSQHSQEKNNPRI